METYNVHVTVVINVSVIVQIFKFLAIAKNFLYERLSTFMVNYEQQKPEVYIICCVHSIMHIKNAYVSVLFTYPQAALVSGYRCAYVKIT